MTEAERDAKIREIMSHQPPYPDPVAEINKVHAAFEKAKTDKANNTGVDPVGKPSPGTSSIKQPGSMPLTGRR